MMQIILKICLKQLKP